MSLFEFHLTPNIALIAPHRYDIYKRESICGIGNECSVIFTYMTVGMITQFLQYKRCNLRCFLKFFHATTNSSEAKFLLLLNFCCKVWYFVTKIVLTNSEKKLFWHSGTWCLIRGYNDSFLTLFWQYFDKFLSYFLLSLIRNLVV